MIFISFLFTFLFLNVFGRRPRHPIQNLQRPGFKTPTNDLRKTFKNIGLPFPGEKVTKQQINKLREKSKLKINSEQDPPEVFKTGFWTMSWRNNHTCEHDEPIVLSAGFRLGQCFSSNSSFFDDDYYYDDDDDDDDAADDDDYDDDFFGDDDSPLDFSLEYVCSDHFMGIRLSLSNDCTGDLYLDIPVLPLICVGGPNDDDYFFGDDDADDDDYDDDDDDDWDDDDYYYYYDDDSLFGSVFELGCTRDSRIKFDGPYLIQGTYMDPYCKEFSSYSAIKADYCLMDPLHGQSHRISSALAEAQEWTDSTECEGTPTSTEPLTVGECGVTNDDDGDDDSRRLAGGDDDGPPKPGAGGGYSSFGSGISTTGSTKVEDDSDSSGNVAVVIGAVIGAVVGCCLIGAIIWFCFSRSNKTSPH